MKKYISFLILMTVAFGFAQDQNYVKTTVYKVPTTTGVVNDEQKQVTVTYYDGLGRPIQQNAYQAGTSGQNIITHIEYDAFGRQTKEFLPFPSSGDLSFIDSSNAASTQLGYYDPQSGSAHARTTVPYSEKIFEASPLNRVLEQGAPGEAWSVTNPDKHTIRFDYQTNAADEVKMYVAQSTWNPTSRLYNCALTQTQFYPTGTLYKSVTKDENHGAQDHDLNTVAEFKDKEGRVILKRTYNFNVASNQVESFDTYYVYDQFGMLSFVLPPLCDLPSKLNDLGYQYRYDHRNRLVEKKLPGKLWEFICYDKLDRVVAAGPVIHPENSNSSAVIYTKYDAFNRVILTAYAALTTQTRLSIQNFYDTATALNEAKSATTVTLGGVATRYTNTVNPTVSYRPLTINYYDDYNFPSANTVYSTVLGIPVFYNNTTQKPKGMATGNWVRVFDGNTTVASQLSTHFYDAKARLIKTHKRNHLAGSYTVAETEYDFSGKTLQKRTAHRYNTTSNELVVRERFIYSAQDRLLRHEHQVNGTNWEILANNSYDELGQLTSKKVGKTDATGANFLQKVDYTYNIRGWLTAINNVANTSDVVTDLFAFKINYNTREQSIPGVKNLYNGNISETYWRTESDGFTRMYGYQYDDLNRLLKGNYRKLGYSVTGNYDESLTYDKHGNIQTLQRNGFADADFGTSVEIDNLAYTYSGNRLLRVTDSSNSLNGFRDGTNSGTDFDYDNYGNMSRDHNKQLRISYNHLNLPVAVEFDNSNRILYHYNALGEKLLKSVRSNNPSSEVVTEYIDGFQYKGGVLKFFPTAEGYVEFVEPTKFFYVYNYTDHLGNVRLSYTQNGNTVKTLEDNHYYPFGLKHENYASERFERIRQENGDLYVIQPTERREWQYKYQGQERQDELELNWDNFRFRNYDYAIGRFMCIDPLAEQYSHQSPYNFSENRVIDGIELEGLERLSVHTPGWAYGSKSTLRNEHPTEAQMKSATFGASLRHPIAALNVGWVERGGTNISSISGRLARHVAENGNMTNVIGSENNAFRHAVWSGSITSQYGESAALDIGNAHEGIPMGARENAHVDFGAPAPTNMGAADSVVDFLNNAIGRELGKTMGKDASEWDVAVQVLGIQLNEGLWTVSSDKDGNIIIARTKISQKQYDAAMRILQTLDRDGMNDADREDLENRQ